jgi:rhodanese-related sulfurtransferase
MTGVQMTDVKGPAPAVSEPAFQEVSPQQVRQWLASGECVLIDVREPDEHARERIPGARLVPLSKFNPEEAVRTLKPGQRLVMHCRSGRRSSDACRLSASLVKSGVLLCTMTGGIEAWKKEGFPVAVDSKVSGISVMRQVQMVVGAFVLVGTVLGFLVHPGFLVIPAFLGAGLLFAGATGWCALATVIGKMPWNRAAPSNAPCASGKCG